MKRWDLALLGAAVICGGGFLASLDHLWPVAELNLETPPKQLYAIAEDHQSLVESKLRDWEWSNQVTLDEPALAWLERTRGPYEVRRFLRSGLPVYLHEIQFKRRGWPESIIFWIHPEAGLVGWRRTLEDDAAGDRIDSSAAIQLASNAVREHLGVDLSGWELKRHESRFLSERTDNAFVFERAAEPGSNVR